MIAALFVEADGVYFGLDGVDPWDAKRDARSYSGPWPVVAHPPCERWGHTCCVEQGHYGHRARKATWLYAVGVELPSLVWGSSGSRERLDFGFHSADERRAARARGVKPARRLSTAENLATPVAFRDLLISIARRT